jgi:hypothetical protein
VNNKRGYLWMAFVCAVVAAVLTALLLSADGNSATFNPQAATGQPKNSIDLLVRPYWVGRSKGGPAATFLVGMYDHEKWPYNSEFRIVTTEDGVQTIPVIMKSTVELLPIKGEARWKSTIYPKTIYLWRFVVRLTNAHKFCFSVVADNIIVGRQEGGTATKRFCLTR